MINENSKYLKGGYIGRQKRYSSVYMKKKALLTKRIQMYRLKKVLLFNSLMEKWKQNYKLPTGNIFHILK